MKLQKRRCYWCHAWSNGGRYRDGAEEGNGAHGEEFVSWAHLSGKVDIVFLIEAKIIASIENSDFLLIGVIDSVFTTEAAAPVMAAVGNDFPGSSFFSVGHIMTATEGAASLSDSSNWSTDSIVDFVGDAAAPWVVAKWWIVYHGSLEDASLAPTPSRSILSLQLKGIAQHQRNSVFWTCQKVPSTSDMLTGAFLACISLNEPPFIPPPIASLMLYKWTFLTTVPLGRHFPT